MQKIIFREIKLMQCQIEHQKTWKTQKTEILKLYEFFFFFEIPMFGSI